MCSITKFNSIGLICANFAKFSIKSNVFGNISRPAFSPISKINIHTTARKNDLMEFFDSKKNWGLNEIKCGRAWTLDELRIKSNSDIHKLWYILLKEHNMLLTMEHECNEKMELFPNPERLDKVKISMSNIENIVRERNRAYYELETGETGERPSRYISNSFGLKFNYRMKEFVSKSLVKSSKASSIGHNGYAVRKFLLLYREKLYNEKRKSKNRDRNHVMMLLRRNPNLNLDLLKHKYPDVDFEKLYYNDQIRGHYVPKID